MDAREVLEYQWPYVLSFLPAEEELERTARAMGALRRKRNVSSANSLLRLAFAYGFCGLTLRQTAAWAEVADVAHLSDVALLKRLRRGADWLGSILGAKLAERASLVVPANAPALRFRLVDATTVSQPGSTGTDWRVHLGFDLERLMIDHIEVTTARGGETFTRFQAQPGELVIGDRGYAHRQGIAHIVGTGAHVLVRLNWQNVPLQHRTGEAFDLVQALRGLPEAIPGDFLVQTAPAPGIPVVPLRFVAIRKSEPAAQAARQEVLRVAAKKHRQPDPRTLEAAGYIFVLTSLLAEHASAPAVLEFYRFRWQVELTFKRLKSLLRLDALPARDPPLAKSFLFAKLLGALLLEDLTDKFLAFSPWGYRLGDSPAVGLAHPARAG